MQLSEVKKSALYDVTRGSGKPAVSYMALNAIQTDHETALAHWYYTALVAHRLQIPECSAASIRTGHPLIIIMT